MQKIFHANGKQKREEVAKLISDKINFKSKTVTRNKEKNYRTNSPGRNNNYKYICQTYILDVTLKHLNL